jgi:hypothetical protein
VTPGLTYAIEVQGSSNTIAIMGARVGSNGLTVAQMYPRGEAVTNGVPAGDAEDYYFVTYADPSFNAPPAVATDVASVSADEGQTATNTGTVSGTDLNVVSLSATIGAVVNNNDGTWSWSFATVDGPAESQTVTITADDGIGGSASTSFELTVANVDPTIDFIAVPLGPVALSSQPVSVIASFSDPAGAADAAYECTVDLGNGLRPQPGTVAGNECSVPGLTYVEPGIYTITFYLIDKDGGSDSRVAEQYIVIYDPNGSFVTGGGWIDSPAGAYKLDLSLSGNATFGFVSKYQKGKSAPVGTTQFQFHAAGMDFESATYEWLVVSQGGTAAQFKGAGTVNGALGPNGQAYKFMLWAGDGAPDRFRIRIWTENAGTETVVYDNGVDQPLGGGSIVVHTKGK